jgi:pimeloyl-ACP methyl ester carboxylesterase
VHAPVLAFYAVPDTAEDVAPYVRENPDIARKTQDYFMVMQQFRAREIARVRANGAKVVEIHGTAHWMWTTHPDYVEREMRAFLDRP